MRQLAVIEGIVTGISIDTRTLKAGDLFVALKDQRDGHDFVSAAFRAGAAAALVSDSYEPRSNDGVLFRVSDTLNGLERLGDAARERLNSDARIIAVTGSAGKTGTKEMLRACLAKLGNTHASEKSYNNHWGVPLTLARMPRETRYGVFEIGMNHAGEIRPLTKMVRPHAAIITTVEAVHLEHFPSVEAIADAKGEIFEGLVPGGAAIIKYHNPYAARLRALAERLGAKAITFGFDSAADVGGEDLKLGHDGSEMVGPGRRAASSAPSRHAGPAHRGKRASGCCSAFSDRCGRRSGFARAGGPSVAKRPGGTQRALYGGGRSAFDR